MAPKLFASLAVCSVVAAMGVVPSAFADDPNCCCTPHAGTSCSDPSCSNTVCAIDPYCCYQQWDGTCAYEAAQLCGAAAPYCIDLNQSGTADVCESGGGGGGGTNPADCDADGIPDLNAVGYAGSSLWLGPTSGTVQPFENPQWWQFGRPGTATLVNLNLPYTQYYNALQLKMNCDNAVRSFMLSDGGTSVLHDFVLDLGGRTLRVAGLNSGFTLLTNSYNTLRFGVASGTIMATDGGLYLQDEGAYGASFQDVTINGGAFVWNSSLSGATPRLNLTNSTLNTTAFSWPSSVQGATPYPTLELYDSSIEFLTSPTGGPQLFTIPDGAFVYVNSFSTSDLSKFSGSNLQVYAAAGSLISLNGKLTVDGTLNLAGGLYGRSHCIEFAQYCFPSQLNAQNLVYPTPNSKAYLNWSVDLSGASGTTPDGNASIRVSGSAWIDGTLSINNISNGGPLALDLTVPLISAGTYAAGHDNFDIVRGYGVDSTSLPAGYFVTSERVGDRINIVVKRGDPIASTPTASSTLTTTPTKMVAIDDGSHFDGLPIVAYATPPATQGSTVISIRKIIASQGTTIPWGTIYGPADLTDMIATDLTGDGKPELVASFGASGQIRAYRVATQPVLLWTCTLPAGRRAESLCALGSSVQSLLPTGPSIGVGTSLGSKGGVGTIGSTGSFSDAGEVAVIPKSVNGTDIDNDDDSDIVAGGESTGSALTGSPTGAIQVMRRNATGGFTALPSVATPGVPTALAVADLDGDGRKDVVASCSQLTGSYPFGARPTGVVLRGAPAVGAGSSASLLRTPAALDVGSSMAQGTGISLVDADADGNLDIALSWQDTGSTVSGGAAVFPVRGQRTAGGLSIGSQLNFSLYGVSQLKRLGPSSVVTLRASGVTLTGSTDLVQDDFAAAPVLGDLDGDGYVTTADIALLLLNFGPCSSQPCEGDLDQTGSVDTGDLAYLLLLFS